MRKLLVAVDGSEQSLKAIDFASELARKHKAELCLVNVIKEETLLTETAWEQFQNIYRAVASDILTAAIERATRQGLEDVRIEVRTGDPAHTIVDLAKQQEVDAIVVGSHGRGQVTGLLLGSVAYKVLSLAPCTVIVVR